MANIVLAVVTCIVTRRLLRRVLPRLLKDMPHDCVEHLTAHTWRASTSTIWEGVYRYDLAPDYQRLRPDLSVLLIHGDQDSTAPVDRVRQLTGRRASWTLHELSGVDHHPMLRDRETPVSIIGAFRSGVARNAIVCA